MRLFLDMDEVLVDFASASARIHRREDDRIPGGPWSQAVHWGLTSQEYWDPINEAGEAFWNDLEPFSWTPWLLKRAEQFDKNFRIISSPGSFVSWTAKAKTLQTLGVAVSRLILTQSKEDVASKGRILVDDNPTNIRSWVECGGIGLLFPSKILPIRSCPAKYVCTLLEEFERRG